MAGVLSGNCKNTPPLTQSRKKDAQKRLKKTAFGHKGALSPTPFAVVLHRCGGMEGRCFNEQVGIGQAVKLQIDSNTMDSSSTLSFSSSCAPKVAWSAAPHNLNPAPQSPEPKRNYKPTKNPQEKLWPVPIIVALIYGGAKLGEAGINAWSRHHDH